MQNIRQLSQTESTTFKNLKTMFTCKNNANMQDLIPVYWPKPMKQFKITNVSLKSSSKKTGY